VEVAGVSVAIYRLGGSQAQAFSSGVDYLTADLSPAELFFMLVALADRQGIDLCGHPRPCGRRVLARLIPGPQHARNARDSLAATIRSRLASAARRNTEAASSTPAGWPSFP
jgi:hypothetical protein